MATQHFKGNTNDQQILSKRSQGNSSTEVFRPQPVTDIPELSKENLLNMLNQIPDLKGRRFNIEYAPSNTSEGYPFPTNLDSTATSYSEPVFIDKLPNEVIQHVKNSNNTALTAALEAAIQKEQHAQLTTRSEPTTSSLYVQPKTMVHHTVQSHEQVQQSRPVSSNGSESSTEVSSSETTTSSSASSSETDCEESECVAAERAENNGNQFAGPVPPNSYSQYQFR